MGLFMQKELPPHARFKVKKIHRDRTGIFNAGKNNISPAASVVYGPTTRKPMLRFRDSLILFSDPRLHNAYKGKTGSYEYVHTSMKAIVLNMPLGDVINSDFVVKDGKQTYVKIVAGGVTEFIQVDKKLITPENLSKSKQIIKAELNWRTNGKENEYITNMLEGNDQMSITLPKTGVNYLKDVINLLFNEKEIREGNLVREFLKEYGNLNFFLQYQSPEVAGNVVEKSPNKYSERRSADISHNDLLEQYKNACRKISKSMKGFKNSQRRIHEAYEHLSGVQYRISLYGDHFCWVPKVSGGLAAAAYVSKSDGSFSGDVRLPRSLTSLPGVLVYADVQEQR